MAAEGARLADSEVLARVNGEEIRKGDLDLRIEAFSPKELEWLKEGRPTLRELLDIQIDWCLAAAAHVAGGYDKTLEGRSAREFLERRLLMTAYLDAEERKRATPERLRQAYEAWVEANPAEERVQLDFILVSEKKTALEILLALRQGASFRELRDRHSLPHRKTDDDDADEEELSHWSRRELSRAADEPLVEEAFALKAGSISSRPVKVQSGWVLVHLLDRMTEETPDFERLRDLLARRILEKDRPEIVAEACKQARIEVLLPEFPDEMPDLYRVAALVDGHPLTVTEVGDVILSMQLAKRNPARLFKPQYPELLERRLEEAALAAAARREGLDRDPDLRFRLRYKLRESFSFAELLRRALEKAKAEGQDVSNPHAVLAQPNMLAAIKAELRADAVIEILKEP